MTNQRRRIATPEAGVRLTWPAMALLATGLLIARWV